MTVVTEKKTDSFLLRLRPKDTPTGVSVGTFNTLTDLTGLTKTELTHLALREYADRQMRRYEDDDGPLTAPQLRKINEISRVKHIDDAEFDALLF